MGGFGGSWIVLGRCFGGTFLRWCAEWSPRGLLESISVPSGLVLGGVWEGFGEVLHDFLMVFRFCFLLFVSLLCFALVLWFWLCFALFSLFARISVTLLESVFSTTTQFAKRPKTAFMDK